MEASGAALLESLGIAEHAELEALVAASETVDVQAGSAWTAPTVPEAAFVFVDHGFVVLRATFAEASRSVVTCEAGEGRLLRPPSREEQLVALTASRLTVLSAEAAKRLLEVPVVAENVVEALAHTLAQNQEAIANFAAAHHTARLRRKLFQLARSYGHVVRDGIRIDFPVSHAVLAEMIGSSRETVTRALDELQRAGFVARSGSSYRLLVPPDVVFGPG
jgi:hypothetical protein